MPDKPDLNGLNHHPLCYPNLMNWNQIQIALKLFFEQGTGIPFLWSNESQRLLSKPMGIMSLENSTVLGQDMSSYTFRDSAVTLDISGQRELTVNVQVLSRHSDLAQSARAYLEQARLAFKNPACQKILDSAGLVFVESHPINDLDFTFSNRKESRASVDLIFRTLIQYSKAVKDMQPIDKVQLQEALG